MNVEDYNKSIGSITACCNRPNSSKIDQPYPYDQNNRIKEVTFAASDIIT